MAKRKTSSANYLSVFISGASITRNGKTTRLPDVNYERIEKDGKVKERGRPAGLKPGASLSDALEAAFQEARSPHRP